MKPTLCRSLALLLLAAAPLASQDTSTPPATTFSEAIEVDLVNVEVFVADRQGNRVAGLKREDFRLVVDGEEVEITNFYAEHGGTWSASVAEAPREPPVAVPATPAPPPTTQRLYLTVFVDQPHLRPSHRKRAFRYLRELVDDGLPDGAQMSIVSFNRSPWVHCDFTSDKRILGRILDEVEASAARDSDSSIELQRLYQEIAEARSPRADPNFYDGVVLQQIRAYAENRYQDARRSLDGLARVLQSLSGVDGRKAVLHVSSGLANRPAEAAYEELLSTTGAENNDYIRDVGQFDVLRELRQIGRIANAGQVTIYSLDAAADQRLIAHSAELHGGERGTISSTNLELAESNAREPMELAAHTTGGRRFELSPRVGDELRELSVDLGSFYSLGFLNRGEPGKSHEIEVEVRRPGLRIRYRETFTDRSRDEKSAGYALAGLLYHSAKNPLGVVLEPLERQSRDDGNAVLPVRVAVPIGNLVLQPQGDVQAAQLSVFVTVQGKDGQARPVQRLPFHVDIPAAALDEAKGRSAAYLLPLVVEPGDLRVAVTVRDDYGVEQSTVILDLASQKRSG